MHPENRDTVPNIGLYSVLFRLPGVQVDDDLSCGTNSGVGRQLQLAIEFFDKVVPNQPGYTSSIAALTILPDVKRLSQAWKKWFECAGKVRRLKFIRERIKQLEDEENLGNGMLKKSSDVGEGAPEKNGEPGTSDVFFSEGATTGDSNVTNDEVSRERISRKACTESDLEPSFLSAAVDVKEESNMEMFLDEDEIEQMSVYYREFSRRSVYGVAVSFATYCDVSNSNILSSSCCFPVLLPVGPMGAMNMQC